MLIDAADAINSLRLESPSSQSVCDRVRITPVELLMTTQMSMSMLMSISNPYIVHGIMYSVQKFLYHEWV